MRVLLLFLTVFAIGGCSDKEIRENYERLTASIEAVPLSEAEVTAGLRDALSRGISRGAQLASARDGYLRNPRLKIPFPQELTKVEKAMRKAGFGADVDRFVRQLNRSALVLP